MKDKARYEADIQTLAKTLYGQARGEYTKVECGLAALIAVGNVIVNRWENVHRWPHTIRGVCRESPHFSCWSPTDPNYKLLQEDLSFDPVFKVCLDLAALMVKDPDFPDLTKGATHYYSKVIKTPYWAKGKHPTLILGNHLFFNLI